MHSEASLCIGFRIVKFRCARPDFSNSKQLPFGMIALYQELGMTTPSPAVQRFSVPGARRIRETEGAIEEQDPPAYGTDGTMPGNLRFAFRYEPIDLHPLSSSHSLVRTRFSLPSSLYPLPSSSIFPLTHEPEN